MQKTFNNSSKRSPADTATKIIEIITELTEIKSPSIYYGGNTINFLFKCGVNIKMKGTLLFTNQIVKFECDVTPKGITSSKISNTLITELHEFFTA